MNGSFRFRGSARRSGTAAVPHSIGRLAAPKGCGPARRPSHAPWIADDLNPRSNGPILHHIEDPPISMTSLGRHVWRDVCFSEDMRNATIRLTFTLATG